MSEAELFYCSEYHCRRSKEDCARLWLAAKEAPAGRDAAACLGCFIGEDNADDLGMSDESEREVDKMGLILGTCKNCEREGLKVGTGPQGLCGTCQAVASKGAEALAAVRERMKNGGVKRGGSKPVPRVVYPAILPAPQPPGNDGDIVAILIEKYNEAAAKAESYMECLMFLKEDGLIEDFEMPELHIVRTEK